jgi:F0F1-type ATP synthase assembly protein I
MNENESEIEKIKIRIQNLEDQKKEEQKANKTNQKNQIKRRDNITTGMFIGGCAGVPIFLISNFLEVTPVGIIISILMTAFIGLIIILSVEENSK